MEYVVVDYSLYLQDDKWRLYLAEIKYRTNTYEDGELWITTRRTDGPSVPENSRINGAQPAPPVNREPRSGNRNDSSKSTEDKPQLTVKLDESLRKQLLNMMNKRPASAEPKQHLDMKQQKPMKIAGAKAKCGLIPNANPQPGSSRIKQSTPRNDQLMKSAQPKETSAGTKGKESHEQSTKSINQKIFKRSKQEPSMPILNEYEPTKAINIERQDQSQHDKHPSRTNSNIQNHLTSNMTPASTTAPKPPAIVEQNPQPNQHNNQKHPQDSGNSSSNFQPRITDVRSMATTSNNQEPRAGDGSNNGSSSAQHTPDTISARLQDIIRKAPFCVPSQPPIKKKMRLENITRNVAVQNRSTLMDETKSLSEPPAREPPLTRIQNRLLVDYQEIQHVPRINIERPHSVTAVDPRVVHQSINNVASASQNSSSTPQQRLNFTSQLNGEQNLPALQQHMQQATRGQNLPQRSSGSPSVDQRINATQHQPNRPNSPTIRMRIPSLDRYPEGKQNRIIGGPELSDQAQLKLIQQESRRPPGILRKAPSPVLSEVPKSIIETLLTTSNDYLSNEQRLKVLMNDSYKQLRIAGLENVIRNISAAQSRDTLSSRMPTGSPDQQPRMEPYVYEDMAQKSRMQKQLVDQPNAKNLNSQDDIVRSTAAGESSSRGVDRECHTDRYMKEKPVSPANGTNSDSGCDTDQEAAFGHEMLTDETVNEAAQNGSSRRALEQQMLDQFATIFTQMGSTLNHTANMFNHLRDSMMETAKTYQTLLSNIEKFNAMDSSASHASSSRNVRQEVPLVAQGIPAALFERGNRDNGNQPSNNAVNEPPEINHNNRWRFVLPPEYDSEDTKWTLKYREYRHGLVELLPRSGIYVSHAELRHSKEESNNCQSLAQRLLVEVFNLTALSVCSSMTEKAQIGYKMRPDARPDLDDHGCLVLLNFILECGLERGWNTDLLPIFQGLDNKVKELRYKLGVISKRSSASKSVDAFLRYRCRKKSKKVFFCNNSRIFRLINFFVLNFLWSSKNYIDRRQPRENRLINSKVIAV
ncbi:unnamed protein product [Pieris macdunnoughi]|uniref:BEN domain-containing protein n=1 Tax=Pieris macdunnoughi TaxID=345717 RepID=A0A821T5I2_9NEOP|nr:unnamed protein product [Pieris macdunnoughi]